MSAEAVYLVNLTASMVGALCVAILIYITWGDW